MTTTKRSRPRPSVSTGTSSPPLPEKLTWHGSSVGLTPPNFPKFPTLEELLRVAPEPSTRRKELGLFDGILGDLTPLLDDYARTPEKYEEDARTLLDRLASGSTSLTRLSAQEKRTLDLATLDFAGHAPARAEKKATPEFHSGHSPLREYLEKRPEARERPTTITELEPFWWER